MTLNQSEAEKLARELRCAGSYGVNEVELIHQLCYHILSGDMKREIENAAYARCAVLAESMSLHTGTRGNPRGAFQSAATAIRALVTSAKTADTEG